MADSKWVPWSTALSRNQPVGLRGSTRSLPEEIGGLSGNRTRPSALKLAAQGGYDPPTSD